MSAALRVRLAVVEDAMRIAELSRDLIEQGLPWRWRPHRIQRAIHNDSANVVVAVVGAVASPVALGIMEYQEDDAYLLLLAFDAREQCKGIGTILLTWLQQVRSRQSAEIMTAFEGPSLFVSLPLAPIARPHHGQEAKCISTNNRSEISSQTGWPRPKQAIPVGYLQ